MVTPPRTDQQPWLCRASATHGAQHAPVQSRWDPPPGPDFFSQIIVKPLAPPKLLCFGVILFDHWWALTVLLQQKIFTKWKKLSSCWRNCAVQLTKGTLTCSVSEMCLHSMSPLSFLINNTPTPMSVLLYLVSTPDLLACIYSDDYTLPLKTTMQKWFSQHFSYNFNSD